MAHVHEYDFVLGTFSVQRNRPTRVNRPSRAVNRAIGSGGDMTLVLLMLRRLLMFPMRIDEGR